MTRCVDAGAARMRDTCLDTWGSMNAIQSGVRLRKILRGCCE
ncbi:hypothetical protein Hoch_2239 [Haliangium ochraceum DSM 14365]|uniref:Uncharacterized protein n=1 Tax=Haliangium ochraceum (strain DSM 14365 / JCM 11303 / SMP-2) TaxID=502025 RepID=D0LHV3_HALO1|nr:hypothetical protein Hoch_2239 [Haliangium ochraceum DSM 14365]